jgi:hypothetical protein
VINLRAAGPVGRCQPQNLTNHGEGSERVA